MVLGHNQLGSLLNEKEAANTYGGGGGVLIIMFTKKVNFSQKSRIFLDERNLQEVFLLNNRCSISLPLYRKAFDAPCRSVRTNAVELLLPRISKNRLHLLHSTIRLFKSDLFISEIEHYRKKA